MSTKPAVPTEPRPAPAEDIRSARPYLFTRNTFVTIVRRLGSVTALVLLDLVGLVLGLYIALVLRELYLGEWPPLWGIVWDTEVDWLPFLTVVTVLVFWVGGLYRRRELRTGVGQVVFSLCLVAIITLAFGLGTDYNFTTTGLIPTAVVTSALAIGLLRAAYDSVSLELMRYAGVRRRLLLVGEGETVTHLERQLGATRGGIHVEIVGTFAGAPGLAGSLERLGQLVERERPDELVLAEADFTEQTVLNVVELAHRHGVKVKLAPTTTELLVHKGEYVPGQGVPLFELRPPMLTGVEWATKRAFDLVVAVVVLLVGTPLWLLIAAAIKLDSRGPVFFVDRRIGVGEREFGMLKFRTMIAGAEAQQAELEEANEAEGALFKIREDPRVTRVGRLLRRFSLDEIPQVVNVVKGEMSLVGPRPLPLRDYRLLEDWHRARYRVLPGMTGLWQISGRSGLSFDDLVRLDFTYLENWSIWLDVSIIAKTIPAVLTRRGAY